MNKKAETITAIIKWATTSKKYQAPPYPNLARTMSKANLNQPEPAIIGDATSWNQPGTLPEWEEETDKTAQDHPIEEQQVIYRQQVSKLGSVRMEGNNIEDIQQDWNNIDTIETPQGKRTWEMFVEAQERMSVQSLEERIKATQVDKEKYHLLQGWLSERLNQLLEGVGDVIKTLELIKNIINFSILRKSDKSFWNKAGGLKQQYLKLEEVIGRKWEEIK